MTLLGTSPGNLYQILTNADVSTTNWQTTTLVAASSNSSVLSFSNNAPIMFSRARRTLGIDLQPTNQTVKAGSNVLFEASASGDLPLAYQWQKNGTNIVAATNSSLSLSHVGFADRGIYAVVVTNAVGSVTSSPAVLNVIMNWYAIPKDGRSADAGNGSLTNAWDLKNALENKGSLILAGDTLWLQSGVYHYSFVYGGSAAWNFKDGSDVLQPLPTIIFPNLSGAPGSPITIRPLPGARATVDGAFEFKGTTSSYIRFQELEIAMITYTNRYTGVSTYFDWGRLKEDGVVGTISDINRAGFNMANENRGIELINCIIHDCANTGVGGGTTNYGCLVYNNGFYNADGVNSSLSAKGYGYYIQNRDTNAFQLFKNSIVCDNAKGGFQVNSQSATNIFNNLWLDGIACYQNGHLAGVQANSSRDDNAGWDLIWAYQGSTNAPFINCGLVNLLLWNSGQSDASTYDSIDNSGTPAQNTFWFTNCIIACQHPTNLFGLTSLNWNLPSTNVVCQNNRFLGGELSAIQNQFPNNTFQQSCPTNGSDIIIQPNDYDPGRGNIIIYNWSLASTLLVDLSAIGFTNGTPYELHQCQDYYNDIAVGVFDGSPITIQMTNHTVAAPVGKNFHPAPTSFPQFGAFIIRKTL